MAWRFHGKATVNPTQPEGFAVCDRCGQWFQRVGATGGTGLRWQLDWRGPVLQNLYILVCPSCYDKPQEQYRPLVIPPDPLPVYQPRPEAFTADDTGLSVEQSVQLPNLLIEES